MLKDTQGIRERKTIESISPKDGVGRGTLMELVSTWFAASPFFLLPSHQSPFPLTFYLMDSHNKMILIQRMAHTFSLLFSAFPLPACCSSIILAPSCHSNQLQLEVAWKIGKFIISHSKKSQGKGFWSWLNSWGGISELKGLVLSIFCFVLLSTSSVLLSWLPSWSRDDCRSSGC